MIADFSEVQKFAADLADAEGRLIPDVRAVVKKAGQNVKDDTRARTSTHPSWKRLAPTVNYTMSGNRTMSMVEIGYDDRGQGELAGIAEFGSARKGPHPALIPASKAEEARFIEAMNKVIGSLL